MHIVIIIILTQKPGDLGDPETFSNPLGFMRFCTKGPSASQSCGDMNHRKGRKSHLNELHLCEEGVPSVLLGGGFSAELKEAVRTWPHSDPVSWAQRTIAVALVKRLDLSFEKAVAALQQNDPKYYTGEGLHYPEALWSTSVKWRTRRPLPSPSVYVVTPPLGLRVRAPAVVELLAGSSGVELHGPQPAVPDHHHHGVLRRAAERQVPDAAAGNLVGGLETREGWRDGGVEG